ncbi:hypothetical protein AVP41_01489 [Microbacterium sp. TNHR37B]|nr:hypothetical protein AVP41_01489 [Microbacterium sp. TNHR37B]
MLDKRLGKRRRVAALLASTALLWGLASTPAVAAGFTSEMSRVATGFSSRWWSENGTESAATRVRYSDCLNVSEIDWRAVFGKVRVHLWRDNGIFPDHNHGRVTSNCNNTWASWGRMTSAGSYKWTVGQVWSTDNGIDYVWKNAHRLTVPALRTEW